MSTDPVVQIQRIDVVPKILDVVCRTTGMGFAAVARVTEDRWIACAVRDEIAFGLQPGGELEVKTTICDEIRGSGQAVIIDHVADDPAWREHHTPRQYGFQSYVSVPIMRGGEFFGTLCAIDPRPARLAAAEVRGMFELFADLIGSHLDTLDRLDRSEQALVDAEAAAELRDQFIAVLGHDLRNPLAAIDAGLRLLAKRTSDERGRWLVAQSEASVLRMARLIDNILDFARGRLGGGIGLDTQHGTQLAQTLEQAVGELRTAHPDRPIIARLEPPEAVEADARRMGQLVSNLLGNAVTHGAPNTPVEVRAGEVDGAFEISVANQGEPIPPEAMARLFQPFTRASVRPNQPGLGLGLYIASEIAKAHGGTLTVRSDETETRFTFRMPLKA